MNEKKATFSLASWVNKAKFIATYTDNLAFKVPLLKDLWNKINFEGVLFIKPCRTLSVHLNYIMYLNNVFVLG